ncbi:hypothetical protein [Sphingomonas sp. CFBP 8765]|uniref:hypothetical protein n=1 Tax=Sphingomonas sp. CFBP 8765 TaxID=2775274 RepID=UPI001A7E7D8F|nr:hypothetical protein [Sphingomonas sp. CFBP 8765]
MTLYSELAGRIRKAARNGSRLHLDHCHVRALMDARLYPIIALMEAEELNALCQQDNYVTEPQRALPRSAMSSEPIGSGIALIETTGPSAGMPLQQMDVSVGLAASRSALAAVTQVTRRKQRKTP